MLKRLLCIYAMVATFNLCATENCAEEGTKILPGALICNCTEDKCIKGDNEEEVSAILGAISQANEQDKEKNKEGLACQECDCEKDNSTTKVAYQTQEENKEQTVACQTCPDTKPETELA